MELDVSDKGEATDWILDILSSYCYMGKQHTYAFEAECSTFIDVRIIMA